MQLRVKNARDFWCGVVFVALGVLAMYLARDYAMGTALEMGPGYFPTWLGAILIGFGLAIGGMAFKFEAQPGEDAELRHWSFRPWIVLPLTMVVYAVLMDAGVGFVPSLLALVIGCALAHKDVHWLETLVLSVCVTAGSIAIFSYGLEMPYRLFWWSP